jgi:hypothetical protein
MAILLLKLDHLVTVLASDLEVVDAFRIPSEPHFV